MLMKCKCKHGSQTPGVLQYAPYMTLANPESTQEGTLSEIKLGFMVCLQLGHGQVFADRIPRYHLD